MKERRRVGLRNRPGRHKPDGECDERENRDRKQQPNSTRPRRHHCRSRQSDGTTIAAMRCPSNDEVSIPGPTSFATPNVAHRHIVPTVAKTLEQRVAGNAWSRQTFSAVSGVDPGGRPWAESYCSASAISASRLSHWSGWPSIRRIPKLGRSEPCQLRLSSRVVVLPAKSHARKDDPGLRFARLSHPLTGL